MKDLIKGGILLRSGVKGGKQGFNSDQLHADVRDSLGLEEEKGIKRHLGKIVGVGTGVGGALLGGHLTKKAGLRMGGVGTAVGMGLSGSLGRKYGMKALDSHRRKLNEKELELRSQSFFGKVNADKETINEIVNLIKNGQSVDQSTEESLFLYANQYFNELTTLYYKPKKVDLKSLNDAYQIALASAKMNRYPKVVKNLREWNEGFLEQVSETRVQSSTRYYNASVGNFLRRNSGIIGGAVLGAGVGSKADKDKEGNFFQRHKGKLIGAVAGAGAGFGLKKVTEGNSLKLGNKFIDHVHKGDEAGALKIADKIKKHENMYIKGSIGAGALGAGILAGKFAKKKKEETKTHSAFPSIATGMILGGVTGAINDRIQKRDGNFIKRNRSALFGTAIGGITGGIVGSRRKENEAVDQYKLAKSSLAKAYKFKDQMPQEEFEDVVKSAKELRKSSINELLKNTAITAGITATSIPVLHKLNKIDNNNER